MRNQIVRIGFLAAGILGGVIAGGPNYISITTYDVDGTNDMITTDYYNGLGTAIQTKLKLAPDGTVKRDRVACTFLDNLGRVQFVTKPFLDRSHGGRFLPGKLTDASIRSKLEASYSINAPDNTRAFSESVYWDDPRGEVRTARGPGITATHGEVKTWVFGVKRTGLASPYEVTGFGEVEFSDNSSDFGGGFIVEIEVTNGSADVIDLLDEMYTLFISGNNPFGSSEATHFLSVVADNEGRISESLTDLFGKTVGTFSGPDITISSVTEPGAKISAGYVHDILGNVVEETPPVEPASPIGGTAYEYNLLGQLHTKTSPDRGKLEYAYYPDGTVKVMRFYNDGDEIVRELRYTYDALSRPLGLREFDPNVTNVVDGVDTHERVIAEWDYDNRDFFRNRAIFNRVPDAVRTRIRNTRGRVSAVVYSNYGAKRTDVGEMLSYDNEGRTEFKIMIIGGLSGYQETRYEYGLQGNLISDYCFYNDQIIKKRYEYDALGQFSKVYHCISTDGGVTFTDVEVAGYSYNDLGVLVAKNFNKISATYEVTYQHDIRDRVTEILKPDLTKGFTESVTAYDKVGNVKTSDYRYFTTATATPTSEFGMAYTYDGIYRLKSVVPDDASQETDYGAEYDYDKLGRFKLKQEGTSNLSSYIHYAANNRLKKTSKNSGGDEYVYDTHGNLVVDYLKKMVVEYDWTDRPVTFRFYSAIPSGITTDTKGTCTLDDVYKYVKGKVDDGTVTLVSTVMMVYSAEGKRVCKMDVQE